MEVKLSIGPGRIAHATGALYLEATGTLLIADAHLGYGWAQRRRGQLGPVTDGGIEERLMAAVAAFEPEEVLFLGDTVHAPKPMPAEREWIEGLLRRLMVKARVAVVQGNHDRAFDRDFGHLPLTISKEWWHQDLVGIHGDRLDLEVPEAAHYLIGHVHPAIRVRDDAGASRRIPAFLVSKTATVLPAFSPFAAGFDILDGPLPETIGRLLGPYQVYPVTGRQILLLRANRSDR
ncbi:metallophosphoesterase [Bryobacter aggregatus]|uniref:metallophosphoesterase n=1 Tax=Bryobacter aggregatus TaxID=360054 RepID=UPI0004E1B319|nr:metallophosphoesterase [Bryobacter aggregatus]